MSDVAMRGRSVVSWGRNILVSAVAVLVGAAMMGVGGAPAFAAPTDPAGVTDTALNACINRTLNSDGGTRSNSRVVTQGDMARLTVLYCYEAGVVSLQGMQYATNLTNLHAWGNQIADVTPLWRLPKLSLLDLDSNRLSDLQSLSGMTQVANLHLGDNQISNLKPLSKLTNLSGLFISGNQISDLTPLSGLYKLTDVFLSGNQISDVTPLSRLTNLTMLQLGDNRITNAAPLSPLTKLTYLDLENNQISGATPLSTLTGLTWLHVGDNQISSVAPLAALTHLTWLGIRNNRISDVSVLSGLAGRGTKVWALGQKVALPGKTVGVPFVNPVKSYDGKPLPVNGWYSTSSNMITPTAAGEKTLSWATGTSDANFSGSLVISVVEKPDVVPSLIGSQAVSATVGKAVKQAYVVSGSPTPSLRVSAGALPPGLSLSAAGELTGTPTKDGSFSFTLTAANRAGSRSLIVNAVVARGVLAAPALAPVVSGTARVGSTLTANAGIWPSGTAVTYQWYANGVAITGATGRTLLLGSSLLGKTVSVKVTAAKTGYVTLVKVSNASPKVAPGVLASSVPKIAGSLYVGKTLTAYPGAWTVGTTPQYRWYANGKAISGATKKTFKVGGSQRGKYITVKVTGSKPGYTTVVRTSKASKIR